ncbi:MAG: BTAD domain-containing putative transcriptional regulator [Pseudomonadota bacterium]
MARIILANGAPVSRSQITDQLWHDRDKQQAQGSLRQCLRQLRMQLGDIEDQVLRIDRENIFIVEGSVQCDLFEENGGPPAEYRGELLFGLDPIAPVFDEWLADERRAVQERQIQLCEDRLEAVRDTPESVKKVAEDLLKFDPCHEAAARAAMSAYAQLGLASQVARVFTDLMEATRSHGFPVSPETRNCYESLRHLQNDQNATSSNGSTRVRVPAIAVGPIPARGLEDGGHFYSELMSDELVGRLTQMPEVTVSFIQDELQDVEVGTKQNAIALQLGADYVLRGALSALRDTMRCRFSVTHAESATAIWSGQKEVARERFFDEASHLADTVCASIMPAVERFESRTRRNVDEKYMQPYDHYLRAKQLFLSPDTDNYLERAQAHLETAIKMDPEFAPAYVILIQSLNTGRIFTQPGSDLTQSRIRALELSERLLNLDARNPNAQIAWGWCMLWKSEYEMAEKSIRTAISLQPYESSRLNAIGTALLYLGYPDEAFDFYVRSEEAMLNDLDYIRTDYGELYYLRGEFHRARSYLSVGDKRTELRTLFWRSIALAQCGTLADARAEANAFVNQVRKRWAGPTPFQPDEAVHWMLKILPLRRKRDKDIVEDGINKIGFMRLDASADR